MASSSTSPSHDDVYNVFINHRGPDVKKGLASHIYRRLIEHGLKVFLDQPELQEGEPIPPQIKRAIRTASVHIAIFSPRYADSTWCLDELLDMLDTVKSGSAILPVFYNVQPLDLRWTQSEDDESKYDDFWFSTGLILGCFLFYRLSFLLFVPMHFLLRVPLSCLLSSILMCIVVKTLEPCASSNRRQVYARALRRLQEKTTLDSVTKKEKPRHDSDTIEKWRKALSDVSLISGFELNACNGDEGQLVDEVVQRVLEKVKVDEKRHTLKAKRNRFLPAVLSRRPTPVRLP